MTTEWDKADNGKFFRYDVNDKIQILDVAYLNRLETSVRQRSDSIEGWHKTVAAMSSEIEAYRTALERITAERIEPRPAREVDLYSVSETCDQTWAEATVYYAEIAQSGLTVARAHQATREEA